MRVYLAGPMRGKLHWNFPAFDEAGDRWRNAGHQVFSPAQVFRGLGYIQGDTQDRNHLEHVIQMDLACIYAADAIALLPGWQGSVGCTVEVAMAQFLGLSIYDAVTMKPLVVQTRPWTLQIRSTSTGIDDLSKTRAPDTQDATVCDYCCIGTHSKCITNRRENAVCACPTCMNEKIWAPGVGHSY